MDPRKMARCALFVSLTVLCAWIGIPMPPVRFTLQTLAVMTALGLLGGKWGAVSVLIYLLLGLAGLPVFSAFLTCVAPYLIPEGVKLALALHIIKRTAKK